MHENSQTPANVGSRSQKELAVTYAIDRSIIFMPLIPVIVYLHMYCHLLQLET